MQINIYLLIIGMALVTYIPRALPAILVDKMKFNSNTEKFLRLVPYTAMAALIFPGILYVDDSQIWVGIVGALVAGIVAWKKFPIAIVVIAAIFADMCLYGFVL